MVVWWFFFILWLGYSVCKCFASMNKGFDDRVEMGDGSECVICILVMDCGKLVTSGDAVTFTCMYLSHNNIYRFRIPDARKFTEIYWDFTGNLQKFQMIYSSPTYSIPLTHPPHRCHQPSTFTPMHRIEHLNSTRTLNRGFSKTYLTNEYFTMYGFSLNFKNHVFFTVFYLKFTL